MMLCKKEWKNDFLFMYNSSRYSNTINATFILIRKMGDPGVGFLPLPMRIFVKIFRFHTVSWTSLRLSSM